MDDQRLLASTSRQELLEAIRIIVGESNYPRRSVVERAKRLGVWETCQTQKTQEGPSLLKLLSMAHAEQDALTAVARKLSISKEAARKRIYQNEDCVECLTDGTYSAREVAEGFCLRRSTLTQLIQQGCLRARRLQQSGKLRISSESIVDFVLAYPRLIDWDRCLKKSSWLRDILESVRLRQMAELLGATQKSLRTWIDRGMLHLRFDPDKIGELFSDEPVYRLLDEYPELVNFARCAARSPEWFRRYEAVRGRYPKRTLPSSDRPRSEQPTPSHGFRLLLRRG